MIEKTHNQTDEAQSAKLREIVHYPNADVVINNDSEYAYLGHRLTELFKDGTPQDWTAIATSFDPHDQGQAKQPNLGPKPGMAIGEVGGVKLLLKVKRGSGPRFKVLKKEIADAAETKGITLQSEAFAIGMAPVRRLNSVLNEISVAPIVKRVVAGDDFQDLARTYGFNSFRYVEPIIGIVDKKTGVKSLVYEYLDGVENLVSLMDKDDEAAQKALHGSMDKDLAELLAQNSIDHGLDAGEYQVLVDSEKNAYLIDAETFAPIRDTIDVESLPKFGEAELEQYGIKIS